MVIVSGLTFDVVPGNFLMAKFEEFQDRLIVCQVVQVESSTSVIVCRWLENDLLGELIAEDSRKSIIDSVYQNIVKCRIKEVTKVADVFFLYQPHVFTILLSSSMHMSWKITSLIVQEWRLFFSLGMSLKEVVPLWKPVINYINSLVTVCRSATILEFGTLFNSWRKRWLI